MRMVRVDHAEAMAARRAANGTASAYRGRPSLAGLTLDDAGLGEDDLGRPATSLGELSLPQGF